MLLRLYLFYVSLCVNFVEGFLLDSSNVNSGNKTVAGNSQNQYITVEKFIQFELLQHENHVQLLHSTAQLREIMQQTFGLLTSQLNDQLKQMNAKIDNNSLDSELHNKYTLLESNFTDIKRQLSKTQNKYTLLEGKFTDIQRQLSETQDKNRKLQEKLDEMKATEATLEKRVSTLESSPAGQSQLNTSRLSERVTKVEAKAMQLQQNQMARSQDFLAMYNDTHNQFKVLKVKDKMVEDKVEAVDNYTHNQVDLLNAKFKLLDSRLTASCSNISGQIREMSRTVALTACADDQNKQGVYIVKFTRIRTSVGITSTSSFVLKVSV